MPATADKSLKQMAATASVGPVEFKDEKPRKGIVDKIRDVFVDERLQRRAELRREIAELRLVEQQAEQKQRHLAKYDGAADSAAEEHRRTCEPLQKRLADIERAIVDAAMERQPAGEKLEEKRIELVDSINNANEVLQDEVDRIERLRKPLQQELHELRKQCAKRGSLEMRLAQPPFANPELLDQQWVVDRTLTLVKARRNEATEVIRAIESELATKKVIRYGTEQLVTIANLEAVKQRLRRWRLDLQKADEDFRAAKAESDSIHRHMLEE